MLGVHWIADAGGCDPARLTVEVVREALIDLPARLDLTRVGEPQIFEARSDGTIAGIVLIAESHVSLHCFPTERALHIDVFSCKAMDLDVARNFVREQFGAEALTEQLFERGGPGPGMNDAPVRVRRAR